MTIDDENTSMGHSLLLFFNKSKCSYTIIFFVDEEEMHPYLIKLTTSCFFPVIHRGSRRNLISILAKRFFSYLLHFKASKYLFVNLTLYPIFSATYND